MSTPIFRLVVQSSKIVTYARELLLRKTLLNG
jgi:hypothetical protein